MESKQSHTSAIPRSHPDAVAEASPKSPPAKRGTDPTTGAFRKEILTTLPPNSSTERATEEEHALLLLTLSNPTHEDVYCILGINWILEKDSCPAPLDYPYTHRRSRAHSLPSAGASATTSGIAVWEDFESSGRMCYQSYTHRRSRAHSLPSAGASATTSGIAVREDFESSGRTCYQRRSLGRPALSTSFQLPAANMTVQWATNVPGGHSVFADRRPRAILPRWRHTTYSLALRRAVLIRHEIIHSAKGMFDMSCDWVGHGGGGDSSAYVKAGRAAEMVEVSIKIYRPSRYMRPKIDRGMHGESMKERQTHEGDNGSDHGGRERLWVVELIWKVGKIKVGITHRRPENARFFKLLLRLVGSCMLDPDIGRGEVDLPETCQAKFDKRLGVQDSQLYICPKCYYRVVIRGAKHRPNEPAILPLQVHIWRGMIEGTRTSRVEAGIQVNTAQQFADRIPGVTSEGKGWLGC
ncbi:hypothetical protein C8R44DRAFT_725175 [Mycena epipterygia]|nr:hypothetical protein C8R44DRAFT_725175 [Mycena epipterygia]